MTMREVVEKLAEAVDNMSIDRACEYCRVEGWPETEQAIALSLAEADRLDAELAAAKARNDKLSRALGTTCWQCEKCGEVRDSRPCVYCELAALKAEKAGSVFIPLGQWKRLVELAAAWNSGDCCAAIADDMAGIIASVEVPHGD